MFSLLAFWMGGAGAVPVVAVASYEVEIATVLSLNAANTVLSLTAVNTVDSIIS